MEFADGGDLHNEIRNSEGQRYTEDEILCYFIQIRLALYHVPKKTVHNHDLKSENVFLMGR